jgi:hypothetical protein
MTYVSIPYHQSRDAAKEADPVLAERLGKTRPVLGAWIGTIGILALLFLMVFKPF